MKFSMLMILANAVLIAGLFSGGMVMTACAIIAAVVCVTAVVTAYKEYKS